MRKKISSFGDIKTRSHTLTTWSERNMPMYYWTHQYTYYTSYPHKSPGGFINSAHTIITSANVLFSIGQCLALPMLHLLCGWILKLVKKCSKVNCVIRRFREGALCVTMLLRPCLIRPHPDTYACFLSKRERKWITRLIKLVTHLDFEVCDKVFKG